ncbi:hypothetical protein R1sor_014250 [Riccia sorocarpa]|uniref:Uncharacterized protein n=1 Tax=Riccia sorocarpa TaxID=122646 RepID=A0ABD3HD14_9MARC
MSAADNGGEHNHMILGVKLLQQLEYGVLLGAHSWINDAFYQRLDSTSRTATLEEVHSGQEEEGDSRILNHNATEMIPVGGLRVPHRREDVKVLDWRADEEGRWVWAKITVKDEEIMVATVYAPNDAAERGESRCCFGDMAEVETENQGLGVGERFLKGWVALRKHIKTLQYEKVAKLNELPEKEKQLHWLMEKDPDTLSAAEQKQLGELISEVRGLQAWKQQRWRQTCRDKFLKDGDVCSAFFFQKFKRRRARTSIRKLVAEGGQLLTSKQKIKGEIYSHFSRLYGAEEWNQQRRAATQELLANVDMRISTEEDVGRGPC